MKKYLLSPLCSAFIVPGLGQIINHDLKKGIMLLFIVFILLIAFIWKMAFMVTRIAAGLPGLNVEAVLHRLSQEDLSTLGVISILFVIVWIYSVLDAFWKGKKLDSQAEAKNI